MASAETEVGQGGPDGWGKEKRHEMEVQEHRRASVASGGPPGGEGQQGQILCSSLHGRSGALCDSC